MVGEECRLPLCNVVYCIHYHWCGVVLPRRPRQIPARRHLRLPSPPSFPSHSGPHTNCPSSCPPLYTLPTTAAANHPPHRCRVLAIWSCRAMASVAATTTLAPALAPRRRARPGSGLLPPRRASAVRCSLDSNVSDMGVNGEERDPFYS